MMSLGDATTCSDARTQIIALRVFEEADDIPCKSFFPLDKTRRFLTREKVKEILKCRCSKCITHRAIFGRNLDPLERLDQIVGHPNRPSDRRDTRKTAFALFALLIYIEHPLLIIGFLERTCSDVVLETSPGLFSRDSLRTHYCSRFAELSEQQHDSNQFTRFASQFVRYLPEFVLPKMDSGVFTVYNANTILPFVKERKIGRRNEDGTIESEGANGKVYAFEIPEEYQRFPHAKGVTSFARKELEKNSDFTSYLEKANLEHARTLNDKHIVKLIKAYKLGGTVNLIFLRAKTNLDHLLRDPIHGYTNSSGGPLESCDAWKQLVGVAKALEKISGSTGSPVNGKQAETQFQGFHFDLKPANILVNDDGSWVITDFGQATFKSTTDGTSRVSNQGGTDAYAPPEIDNLDERFSRRYDVWSLGCVILEVVAFLVLGHDGLHGCAEFRGLDQVRCTKAPWARGEDSRFFSRESLQSEYKVKKEITHFISFLKSRDRVDDQRSKNFLDKILALVEKMLEPQVEERIDIGEVVRRLDAAIKQASAVGMRGERLEMIAAPGERSVGGTDLSSLPLWHWNAMSSGWESSSLQIFEQRGNLRTYCIANNNFAREDHLIRSNVKLIPRYAFRPKFHPQASEAAIYFSDSNPKGTQEYPGLIFSFTEAQDARDVQSIITSQKIEVSFPLENIQLKRFISFADQLNHLSSRISGFFNRNSGNVRGLLGTEDLGPGSIQLWTETVEKEITEQPENGTAFPSKSNTGREVRKQPHQQAGYREAAPRRAVLYLHNSRTIITIAMDRNWHDMKGDTKRLDFIPKAPDRDPSFVACSLQASHVDNPDSFPGVPLCPVVLRRTEYSNKFEVEQFELTFATDLDRDQCSKKFNELRKAWYTETKEVERVQGFTPTYRPPDPEPDLHEHEAVVVNSKSKGKFFLKDNTPHSSASSSVRSPEGKGEWIKKVWKPDPPLASHMGGGRAGSRPTVKSNKKGKAKSDNKDDE